MQDCLIAQTRYTQSSYEPAELVGCPRTVRYQAELVRAEGYTRWRKGVALLAAALLGVTYFLYFCLFVSLGEPYFTNHRTCEFQQLACTTRGALYRCADGSHCDHGCPDGAVYQLSPGNLSAACALDVESSLTLDWATDLLGKVCDPARQAQSYAWCVPLPLLFVSSVVLPMGLFRNNAHKTTAVKVLVWTPVVPLILLQCLIRAIIFLSMIPTAADRQFAQITSAEALVFMLQVGALPAVCTRRAAPCDAPCAAPCEAPCEAPCAAPCEARCKCGAPMRGAMLWGAGGRVPHDGRHAPPHAAAAHRLRALPVHPLRQQRHLPRILQVPR